MHRYKRIYYRDKGNCGSGGVGGIGSVLCYGKGSKGGVMLGIRLLVGKITSGSIIKRQVILWTDDQVDVECRWLTFE